VKYTSAVKEIRFNVKAEAEFVVSTYKAALWSGLLFGTKFGKIVGRGFPGGFFEIAIKGGF